MLFLTLGGREAALRPVWSVLTDLCEYVRDRVVIPLKPFFIASHF